MYRISLVAAVCVAMLAFAAPPAGAEATYNGPNCQGDLLSSNVTGIGAKEAAANFGFASVQDAQDWIQAYCANRDTNVPRCELGQGEAAAQALARGDMDQYMLHWGNQGNCYFGNPPGTL